MGQRYIIGAGGRFGLHVHVHCAVLEDALEHDTAEEVLKCAVILCLSVLAQDGPWPQAFVQYLRIFMRKMKMTLRREELIRRQSAKAMQGRSRRPRDRRHMAAAGR